MCAVHVSIRHQNALVIAHVLDRELFLDPRADRGDDRPDFLVRQNLVDSRALDVENFSAERKNRLECAIATLLRGSTRAVALDQIDLAQRRIAQRAISEFPRKIADIES